jgi:hypothetical protein
LNLGSKVRLMVLLTTLKSRGVVRVNDVLGRDLRGGRDVPSFEPILIQVKYFIVDASTTVPTISTNVSLTPWFGGG